jgi:molecular chaperone GrpE (heat shock protein)
LKRVSFKKGGKVGKIKAKTAENKNAEAEKAVEAEKTAEALEAKTAEVEALKKEVAKKEEQLNKKAIAEFNDEALFSIADCIEVLIKKHCPIPEGFDFTAFESDLFEVIGAHWDLKAIEK